MVSISKYKQDIDKIELSFGKHKGTCPFDLLESDPSYIVWLYENLDREIVSDDLYEAAQIEVEDMDHTEDQFSIY